MFKFKITTMLNLNVGKPGTEEDFLTHLIGHKNCGSQFWEVKNFLHVRLLVQHLA